MATNKPPDDNRYSDSGNEQDSFWMELWREGLTAMTLGWDLALPIFGGTLLGYALDRWLETGHTFTMGLLMLGIMVGYYNVARFSQRINRLDRRRDEKRKQAEEEADK
jgi:F0F1-type ATP synthase assembly protein I